MMLTLTVQVAISLAFTNALDLIQRDMPDVINLPTHRRSVHKRDNSRRRQTVSETLTNGETLYYASVTIGSPPQSFQLHLDTGSSDMWMNYKGSEICQEPGNLCSASGTYDANASATYEYLNNDFNISYVDGSGASGDYATDNVTIGGKTIEALQVGIAYKSNVEEGILGIGLKNDEAAANSAQTKAYSNLPQAMVDSGLIQSNAYSLYLDDIEAATGSILFGGIDTAKFSGELMVLPFQQESGEYVEFVITLTGLMLNAGNVQNFTGDLPTAVILDSGSSLSYLPTSTISDLYTALGVQYSEEEGTGLVECSLKIQNATVDFSFTSVTILVPISELILDASGTSNDREDPNATGNGNDSNGVRGSDGSNEECIFGIAPADGTSVLGDTFLRSAYVVCNLESKEIALAQASFNATGSNIVEISSGKGIPSATTVSNVVQALASSTGGAGIGSPSTRGSTTTTSDASASMTQVSYFHLYIVLGLAIAFTVF